MAEYFTYGQFVTCTNLVDFQRGQGTYHKMNLVWDLPVTDAYKYDRVELYRYIGDYMACINPNGVSEALPGAKLIYTAKQNTSGTGSPLGTTTITTYSPNGSTVTSTINTNLTAVESYVDDFTSLTSAGYDLDVFHSLPGIHNNQTIINDISFTRRALYYVIKTYIKGVTDSAPYILTPDWKTRIFANHSSKSQVRHDYLHYEGDEIWRAFEAGAGNYAGLSRTAVDINRLYLDATQAGPTGRGGYAWVSDRDTNKIFQHNLKDGYTTKVWTLPGAVVGNRGFGIGIDGQTGDCIAGPGDWEGNVAHPIVYRCKISNGTATPICTLPSNRCAYGITALFNNPDKMLITDHYNRGPAQILNLSNNTTRSCGVVSAYAAAACPNGKGIQKSIDTYSYIAVIDPNTPGFFKFNLSAGGVIADGTRIGVDQYSSYPNTILNKDIGTTDARDYFAIWAETEWGVTIPANSTSSSQCTINWALKWTSSANSYLAGSYKPAAGYDGENNTWVVDGSDKSKLYRTAHDRTVDDGIDDSVVFPYGGESRYPAVELKEWPFTFTNTREIEWFLTRNHGVSTIDISTIGTTNIQKELDPSTLDKYEVVNDWYPGLSANAYDAWWSLVEEKMLRKHYSGGSYLITNNFKVYDTIGNLDGNTMKWGIRMQMSAIQAELSGSYASMNRDLFYETQSLKWQPKISARIQAWSNAFANKDLSYIGVSDRTTKIEGNIKGIRVHPHYTSAPVAVDSYYINPSLTTTQKTALEKYAKSLKYVNLKNLLVTDLYMYSDFTGNILVGSLDSSPLNRDIIHPDPTDPILALSVSGYETNPYPDAPAYCYPWKNTIPVSMSASYNAITGYDDFNVTYTVSSDMGSYLLTAFSLSTDDYWPTYLSDTLKQDVITSTTNTSYLSTNVYNSVVLFTYKYQSPSMNGLSGNLYPAYGYPSGKFNPKADTYVKDLYDYDVTNGCRILNVSADATVAVLERWPEPKFYVNASLDSTTVRQDQFCRKTWGIDRFNKTSSIVKESNTTDAKRYDITYGVDPISAVIQDRSIARTWPISSWTMTITTDNQRLGWTTKSFIVTSDSILNVLQDEQNRFDTISAMPFRYGNYMLTMNVQASTTTTSSDKPFVQYIKVSEFEPFANFWAISASTVSPNFSATNASISAQLVDVSPIHNGSTYPYVSGYAPNLTVYFQDSSEAHTFPISAYHWNFGDPFNEGPVDITDINSNYYTISSITDTSMYVISTYVYDYDKFYVTSSLLPGHAWESAIHLWQERFNQFFPFESYGFSWVSQGPHPKQHLNVDGNFYDMWGEGVNSPVVVPMFTNPSGRVVPLLPYINSTIGVTATPMYNLVTSLGFSNFNDPCWKTNYTAHTAVHTYIMPGTYDVTLTVNASCTNTADVCARYIDDPQHFYIYVEEIPPQCNDSVHGSLSATTGFTKAASGINGGSPLTAYFMASGIIAGSFPIGRMDWDFGDGTVQRITRYPLTQITTQGLPVVNISAYSYDLDDPRNVVVPHVFVNQTELNQTLSVKVSAYAANTNTMQVCNRTDLISPLSAEINIPKIDTKKLIGSRFDDNGNLVYIVEGQDENTTYTVALSGELN